MTESTSHLRAPRGAVGHRSPGGHSPGRRLLAALPWILPALILIFGVVLFPAGFMIFNSTRKISISGLDLGPVGWHNYQALFARPELTGVLVNTAVWVFVVVLLTVVLSLGLANLLDKEFPGRRWVRMTVLVPWAASVVMTTTVFVYGLDPFYGIINKFLVDVHVLAKPYGFTQQMPAAFVVAICIAVFVSLPFTTYTILAGLSAIPGDIVEAAKMDGAGPVRTYFAVILPNLRGAVSLAVLINIINVFNSLPILRLITGTIPGNGADTTTTLVFKILQSEQRIDISSALSVVNFAIVLVVVAVYLRVVKPMKEIQ